MPPGSRLRTLDVLLDDHVFGQQPALTADRFRREAELRGIKLPADVDRLSRDGVLLPFFGIKYDAADLISRANDAGTTIDADEVKAALQFTNTDGHGLLRELAVGDLFDPAETPEPTWSETRTYEGLEYSTRRYLYSPYQLLGIRDISSTFGSRYRPSEPGSTDLVRWATTGQLWWRNVAAVLSALEAAFRPAAVPRLAGFDLDIGRWARYHAEFDVAASLSSLGVQVSELVAYGERLLSIAHHFDPLRDWSKLVDLINFERLGKLRGEALLAWEHRVAAEIFLLAYESEVRRGNAEELPNLEARVWQPLHFRLSSTRQHLDQVLTQFGLSPHPSLLVVLEGEIEHEVLEKLLESRLRAGWRTSISLQTMRGLERDISELASYIAPSLTNDDARFVRLSRPLTHVLIAGDPEGSFRSLEGRETVRRRWVERMVGALPSEWRTPTIKEQLDRTVEIFVWNSKGESFEFAQFTDWQLAEAIREVSQSPDTPSADDIRDVVAAFRLQRRNLRRIWAEWVAPKPKTSDIVRALLPRLVESVNKELDDLDREEHSPLATLVLRILQVSSSVTRSGYIGLSAKAVDSSDSPGPHS
jgi:hypothetical protein